MTFNPKEFLNLQEMKRQMSLLTQPRVYNTRSTPLGYNVKYGKMRLGTGDTTFGANILNNKLPQTIGGKHLTDRNSIIF